jgi:hypothetical protein
LQRRFLSQSRAANVHFDSGYHRAVIQITRSLARVHRRFVRDSPQSPNRLESLNVAGGQPASQQNRRLSGIGTPMSADPQNIQGMGCSDIANPLNDVIQILTHAPRTEIGGYIGIQSSVDLIPRMSVTGIRTIHGSHGTQWIGVGDNMQIDAHHYSFQIQDIGVLKYS